MGAWGVTIFSDDTACDVKDVFIELVKCYDKDEDIVKAILSEFSDTVNSDEAPLFWYALAHMQWKYGRLTEEVKQKAVHYVDHPDDDQTLELFREEGERVLQKRLKVLQDLKARILSPMPNRKNIKVYENKPAAFRPGDIIAYPLNIEIKYLFVDESCHSKPKKNEEYYNKHFKDKYCLCIVLEYYNDRFSKYSDAVHEQELVAIFKWYGEKIPSIAQIEEFDIIKYIHSPQPYDVGLDHDVTIYKNMLWMYNIYYDHKLKKKDFIYVGNNIALAQRILNENQIFNDDKRIFKYLIGDELFAELIKFKK